MNFTEHKFSKRFPPVTCAIFVVHEPQALNVTSDTGFDLRTVPARVYRGTAAAIILPDGRFWVGVTLCSPMDQFVRATGRNKAIGRAFRRMAGNDLSNGNVPFDLEASQWKFDELKACLRVEIDEMKKGEGDSVSRKFDDEGYYETRLDLYAQIALLEQELALANKRIAQLEEKLMDAWDGKVD